MKFAKLFCSVLLVGVVLLGATRVSAETFSITGNGANSTNSVLYDASSNTNIHQSNTIDVTNNINANANTGGNSINNGNGGSITTGNATVTVNVTNNLNNNSGTVACCQTPTPTKVPPVVTPNPTSTPSNGDGHCTENCGSSNPSTGTGGGQVLGLSGTSGEPVVEYLFYASGTICLVAAKKLLSVSAAK